MTIASNTTLEKNMDKQDLQDDRRFDLPFGEIAKKTSGCAFEVKFNLPINEMIHTI